MMAPVAAAYSVVNVVYYLTLAKSLLLPVSEITYRCKQSYSPAASAVTKLERVSAQLSVPHDTSVGVAEGLVVVSLKRGASQAGLDSHTARFVAVPKLTAFTVSAETGISW